MPSAWDELADTLATRVVAGDEVLPAGVFVEDAPAVVERDCKLLDAVARAQLTRMVVARVILHEWDRNTWDGSTDADQLCGYRYAVVIERANDSWVLGADSAQDVADIALDTLAPDDREGSEWVVDVYALETGRAVAFDQGPGVTVSVEGEVASAGGTLPARTRTLSDTQALDRMHELMDGTEWDAETSALIAEILTETGRTVREPEVDARDQALDGAIAEAQAALEEWGRATNATGRVDQAVTTQLIRAFVALREFRNNNDYATYLHGRLREALLS